MEESYERIRVTKQKKKETVKRPIQKLVRMRGGEGKRKNMKKRRGPPAVYSNHR